MISVKKKEPAVERIIKFVIFFVKFIQEQGLFSLFFSFSLLFFSLFFVDTQPHCFSSSTIFLLLDPLHASFNVNQDAKENAEDNAATLNAFVDFLLRYLLQGVESKDKAVRFRTCQLTAMIMDCIEEVE